MTQRRSPVKSPERSAARVAPDLMVKYFPPERFATRSAVVALLLGSGLRDGKGTSAELFDSRAPAEAVAFSNARVFLAGTFVCCAGSPAARKYQHLRFVDRSVR